MCKLPSANVNTPNLALSPDIINFSPLPSVSVPLLTKAGIDNKYNGWGEVGLWHNMNAVGLNRNRLVECLWDGHPQPASIIFVDADLWSVSGQKLAHICFHCDLFQ